MGMTDGQWKGYLRAELKNEKEIQKAINEGDIEKAKELIDELVQRTQQNIEDV